MAEITKMNFEFDKDLEKNKYPSRVHLPRYLKNADKKDDKNKEQQTGTQSNNNGQDETEVAIDPIMSRNPKMNVVIAPGIATQLELNTNLLTFKLLYYRLHHNAWRTIGCALGKSKTLKNLCF